MSFRPKNRHPKLEAEEHPEDLCRKCGLCCHAKVVVGDEVFLMDDHCPYLDPATNLCTIYERRHKLNPQCLTIDQGIKLRAFPAGCPYVAGLSGYKPPRTDWTFRDIELARKRELEKQRP